MKNWRRSKVSLVMDRELADIVPSKSAFVLRQESAEDFSTSSRKRFMQWTWKMHYSRFLDRKLCDIICSSSAFIFCVRWRSYAAHWRFPDGFHLFQETIADYVSYVPLESSWAADLNVLSLVSMLSLSSETCGHEFSAAALRNFECIVFNMYTIPFACQVCSNSAVLEN